MISNKLFLFNYYFFILMVSLIWILTIIVYLKLYPQASKYLQIVSYYIKIYVSLFLIIRFNPIYNFGFFSNDELDRKISYSAGLALLITDTPFLLYLHDLFSLKI